MLENATPADDLPLDAELPEVEAEPEQVDADAELVITIGDDAPEDDAGADDDIDTSGMAEAEARTVKDTVARLRANMRAKEKQAKEAERKAVAAEAALAAREAAAKPKIEDRPYPKPIDYGYDDDLHQAAVLAWTENQVAVKAERSKQEATIAARQASLQERFEAYSTGKKSLRVPGFDTAEAAVMAELSNEQQQAILECAADPAKLVYALGNSPKARKELAALTDPRLFAYRLAKIEGEIKVTQKTPPPPETRLRGGVGSGSGGGSLAAQIAAAEKQAQQSGDYSKLFALRRQQKAAAGKA